ncbi:cell division protein ZapE [Lentzea sp. BCCO 10_0798]|uniref:Cell division protein ZapE n=1 Tax=Lentzea kristufekii TaxID=3095430 RepID=A0ABU4TT97_9PSEU|nr:cell division protein ZapE [Lentzea sp. BCCO 10_0798]MDX8051061.1 cell division protein ZapE [Lentzea sp. BCCO 10_0798]
MSSRGYELDAAQLEAVARLAELGERRRGVYLHGPVGRGKSFLADALFDVLPEPKKRVHFHAFFQELHRRISERLRERGAVARAVRELVGRAKVLAFDELHVHDVGDAMLMTRLLEALQDRKVMIIATSNYPPDGLLPDPLHHDHFLPGIALVKELMDVVELNGPHDYRHLRGAPRSRFETGEIVTAASLPATPVTLDVNGRAITALGTDGSKIWFDFGDLCEKPTSTQDYLVLAERFDDWVIVDVPRLNTRDREARQRFANVVDVLVDKDVRLTLVSDHLLGEIIGGEARDLARTASRLELINTTG